MPGSFVLSAALLASIASMVLYFLHYRGNGNILRYARISYHASAMLVIIASAFFLYNLVTHQYQYHYVYHYSSNDLPTGLLISSFWAGQEGSFMLWLLLTAMIGVFLLSYSSTRDDLEPRVMMVYSLALSFLLFMVSPWMKNPFALLGHEGHLFLPLEHFNPAFFSLKEMQEAAVQDGSGKQFIQVTTELMNSISAAGYSLSKLLVEGKGLNQLLQNFWMQIHPPILFVGFSLSTVPFVFAMAALIKNDYSQWVRQAFPWMLACAGVLGLGIMLGGYWAYGILGWGGYWAWDPVENSSLVPWLVCVAAIHTMLVQRKTQNSNNGTGRFAKTNLLLSMLVYLFVLYSTFLTRSGVLGDASVHSFVDPGMIVYLFLVSFIGTFLIISTGMIVYRWNSLNFDIPAEESTLSRELSLFTAAVTLGASALIVIVGTSAPIFGKTVDIFFYDDMHIPLGIILMGLNGLSLLLKWKTNKGGELLSRSRFSIAASLLLTVLSVFLGVTDLMMILLAFTSFFALIVNIEVATKIIKGNPKLTGAYVAHIGIALFIIGVIGSAAYSSEKDIELVKGESVSVFERNLEYTGYRNIPGTNKFEFLIDVEKGSSQRQVAPIIYGDNSMKEPDYIVGWTSDFYISPMGFNPDAGSSGDVTFTPGKSVFANGYNLTYMELISPDMGSMQSGSGSFGIVMKVEKDGITETVNALLKIEGGNIKTEPVKMKKFPASVQLISVQPGTREAIVNLSDNNSGGAPKEVLLVKASIKPMISLVWIGVGVMVFGFIVSMLRRLKESRN